jgi:hypothetical protein
MSASPVGKLPAGLVALGHPRKFTEICQGKRNLTFLPAQ